MRQVFVNREELANMCHRVDVEAPQRALEPLATYLETLTAWNRAINLVGLHTWQDIFSCLVVDSFHLAHFLDTLPLSTSPLVWDLGSGAGLPGIPLRLVWERGQYHLVELREKRALFLSTILARLRLPRTFVHRMSVERFFQERVVPADCIVSRAFLPWRQLLDLTAPQLQTQGVLVIMAHAPKPDALPAPWRVIARQSYDACGKKRWFWALCPDLPQGCGTADVSSPGAEYGRS